ncbi:PEPxxWA-CTERM sorting domain-containing protein [Phenylobacterium sp.]|uniref:PEPxxWA-CTERM sorting domain-containing protein n=1 Tax=Phenylobacterium sp. TaxID=1871053 RepID=UPI002EDB118F
MKTCLTWLALPAIAITLASAQPAAAAVVTYTYTGYVDTGVDQIGLFGGGPLDGLAFTAVFARDDALADDLSVGDVFSYVRGPEAVKAKLAIGGTTIDVGGVGGEQSQYDDGAFEGFFHSASSLLGGFSLGASTMGTFAPTLGDVLPGPDYHTLSNLDPSATPGFAWFGRFDFGAPDPNDETRGLFTNGRFVPTALVVSPEPGAVPEPATWAMMILGFGGVGATFRRRRAMAAFA